MQRSNLQFSKLDFSTRLLTRQEVASPSSPALPGTARQGRCAPVASVHLAQVQVRVLGGFQIGSV